jgi:hypothetical protein
MVHRSRGVEESHEGMAGCKDLTSPAWRAPCSPRAVDQSTLTKIRLFTRVTPEVLEAIEPARAFAAAEGTVRENSLTSVEP